MTKEQEKISWKNRRLARIHFGILGNGNLVLHHVDVNMKYDNIERYILWLPEDLVVMTRGEHSKLHHQLGTYEEALKIVHQKNTGTKRSEEQRANMSKGRKGKGKGINTFTRMSEENQLLARERSRKNMLGKQYRLGIPSPHKGRHWKLVNGVRTYYD